MKEYKNIIEIYKHRKYNEYLKEKREKIEAIEKEDKIQNILIGIKEKITEVLKKEDREHILDEYNFSYPIYSKATIDKIAEVEKEYKDKIDDRNREIEEIMAQVEITETYEQAIEIYKKYGVITSEGKLYDYK